MAIPIRGMRTGMSIWEISLAFANRIYNTAYVFLVLGAVFTAVSTIALFWTSGVRDKYSSIEIAEAHATSDQAKSTAASAQQRVGELALMLEQERAKVLELQKQFSWRTLTDIQVKKLSTALKSKSRLVHLRWVSGDPESYYFANQLAGVFQLSGWVVAGDAMVIPSLNSFGVSIPTTQAADVNFLRVAFVEANIDFNQIDPPQVGMTFGAGPKPDDLVIFVAPKAPTALVRITAPLPTTPSAPAPAPP